MKTKPTDLQPLEFAPGLLLVKPKDRAALLRTMREAGLRVYDVAGQEFVSESEWQSLLAELAVQS